MIRDDQCKTRGSFNVSIYWKILTSVISCTCKLTARYKDIIRRRRSEGAVFVIFFPLCSSMVAAPD